MTRSYKLPLLVAAVAWPSAARADSDGYYCIGHGYLAYQFGLAAPPVGPHRLYVLHMRSTRGVPTPVALDLPQFQVHGMRCGDGWIDVASFNAVYHVVLDSAGRRTRYEVRSFPAGQGVPSTFIQGQSNNLGSLSGAKAFRAPVRVHLAARDGGGEFRLEIVAVVPSPAHKCELAVTSRVVAVNAAGREEDARVLFQGRGYLECGE